ncbi:hypothetical protein LJ737_13035 [Hymenobacter sp. 15J16-1T3B]|uniref:MbnP family protein n=1 Tax=Hymenobacter sp. 15J16-1T3B TaxID=2886941 RepID=UPI001D11B97A|nr:MbnP family protein [Hymenobacter sp. 15J16-1T3B]MCC3158167.1 hypothetical protein [Hymenobacter sp. 15J16-1T3B]
MLFRTLSTTLATLLLGATLGLTACDDDNPTTDTPTSGKLNFEFENVVGSQSLTFGNSYTTLQGDQFTVSKFNYIISNIKLTKADGSSWAEPESYHLVKQADMTSRNFEVSGVPFDDYTGLTFTIGVDAARNTAGAQTGALSPDNDMYWGWTTGYIFLKMEGTSQQSPTGAYTYHVGGFQGLYNSVRTVSLPLPAGVTSLHISATQTPQLHLKADVQKLFTGPKSFRTSQINHIMSADSNAVRLAMNYAAGMFRLDHVHSGE